MVDVIYTFHIVSAGTVATLTARISSFAVPRHRRLSVHRFYGAPLHSICTFCFVWQVEHPVYEVYPLLQLSSSLHFIMKACGGTGIGAEEVGSEGGVPGLWSVSLYAPLFRLGSCLRLVYCFPDTDVAGTSKLDSMGMRRQDCSYRR